MQTMEQLYRAYRDDVYRYLCSLTRDADAAEDLLSETFLRALRGLSGYDGRADVKTWLCAIARNAWIDALRRKKPALSYDELLARYRKAARRGRRRPRPKRGPTRMCWPGACARCCGGQSPRRNAWCCCGRRATATPRSASGAA